MTTITNNTVTLTQNPDGTFNATFSDGTGFNFIKQDFLQCVTSIDRQFLLFYVALQAFVKNGTNPNNMTLSQIKTLLEAQTYPAVTTP